MSCAVCSHFGNGKRRGLAHLIALATSLMLGLWIDWRHWLLHGGHEGFNGLLASINVAASPLSPVIGYVRWVVTCFTPRRIRTGPPVTTTPKRNYRYRPG